MNRRTLKKLYREAIVQVFGTGDPDLDKNLCQAVSKDIHLGDKAPGQWSPGSVLEIYCESGIPNATDIHDFRAHAAEFGVDPSNAISYNSDRWAEIDGIVNLMLSISHPGVRVYHEPYNNAVINIGYC